MPRGLLMTSVEHCEDSAEHEAREGEVVEDLERTPIQINPERPRSQNEL
jgi:hypothetical protein